MANVFKYVDEERVFTFDFSNYPEISTNGETIASCDSVTAVPASELTIGTPSVTSPKVFVKLSDGTAGITYAVYVKVTTSGGNVLIMEGDLPVRGNG